MICERKKIRIVFIFAKSYLKSVYFFYWNWGILMFLYNYRIIWMNLQSTPYWGTTRHYAIFWTPIIFVIVISVSCGFFFFFFFFFIIIIIIIFFFFCIFCCFIPLFSKIMRQEMKKASFGRNTFYLMFSQSPFTSSAVKTE